MNSILKNGVNENSWRDIELFKSVFKDIMSSHGFMMVTKDVYSQGGSLTFYFRRPKVIKWSELEVRHDGTYNIDSRFHTDFIEEIVQQIKEKL